MKKMLENVKFVDYYYQAPKTAQYILRVYDGEWVLEKYSKDNNYVTSQISFIFNVLLVEDFHKLLSHCRNLVPKSETLWVEKPNLMEGNDPELNSLYKFCIDNDPITDDLEALWAEEIFWEKLFPED